MLSGGGAGSGAGVGAGAAAAAAAGTGTVAGAGAGAGVGVGAASGTGAGTGSGQIAGPVPESRTGKERSGKRTGKRTERPGNEPKVTSPASLDDREEEDDLDDVDDLDDLEVGEGEEEVARQKRRVEARKERNRRAQRSFRQRQKAKMSGLEAEVAALTSRLDGLRASNLSLTANVSLLRKVLMVREQQVLDLQRKEDEERQRREHQLMIECFPQSDRMPELSAILFNGQPLKVSQVFLSKMSPEQMNSIWMAYGQDIRANVRILDGPAPDPSAHARVIQLTREFLNVIIMYVRLSPDNFMKLRYTAERSMPPDFNINGLMRDGVRSMNLEEAQKYAIVNKWKWLLKEHCRYNQEILSLEAQMKTDLPSTTVGVKLSESFLQHDHIMQKIQDLFKERLNIKLEYLYYVAVEVIRPYQAGRMIANCFPVIPNSLSIAEVLANELGEIDSLPVHNNYSDYSAVAIPAFVSCNNNQITDAPKIVDLSQTQTH